MTYQSFVIDKWIIASKTRNHFATAVFSEELWMLFYLIGYHIGLTVNHEFSIKNRSSFGQLPSWARQQTIESNFGIFHYGHWFRTPPSRSTAIETWIVRDKRSWSRKKTWNSNRWLPSSCWSCRAYHWRRGLDVRNSPHDDRCWLESFATLT